MRILVTRPGPAAGQTARRLNALGHEAVVDPMLTIRPLEAALPAGPFDALTFTSLNGVAAFAAHPRGAEFYVLPVFAVGGRTAGAARAAGFARVFDCGGEARSLARAIAAGLPPGARVLHPAGADRAADLQHLLAGTGIEVVLSVLYAAVPAPGLGADARAGLAAGTIGAVLHFSRRTAQALLACATSAGLAGDLAKVRHLCLSTQAGAPLAAAGFSIEVAAAPTEAALLELL